MSKIYPHDIPSSSSSNIEVFTIWMKSLVMHGNGSTVTDSIHLMDVSGKVLFTILRKKLRLFGRWEGSKSGNGFNGKPWFQVRKLLNHGLGRNVRLRSELEQTDLDSYRMERLKGSELKQKQSSGGVVLGDNIMGLVVEPHVDHSFIMALIVVHGLVNGKR
ncbi:hypothetical protein MKX01_042476 [Papaver californicum]|nr:hypothetical protein MKX01_042476 [Papaver californicum]